MQTNILWSGIEYYSLENCVIDCTKNSVDVRSSIIGLYNGSVYRLEYTLNLDDHWQIRSCSIQSQCNDQIGKIELLKNGKDWLLNGKKHPEFKNCTDVDIPLTPLTNSLPINRLQLNAGQTQEIDIIYIDLLEDSIKHVQQKYERISAEVYHYENIPNDFEANITVDGSGFVINYPELFKRTALVKSNYIYPAL